MQTKNQAHESPQAAESSDETLVFSEAIFAFHANLKHLRIVNLFHHAHRLTVGDILAVTEYHSASVSVSLARAHNILFSSEVIWKRVREYFILPSMRPAFEAIYPMFRDSPILIADRVKYDELKRKGLLPSTVEKSFGKHERKIRR